MPLVSKVTRLASILLLAAALSAPSANRVTGSVPGRTIHWVLDIDHVLLDYTKSVTGKWRDQSNRILFESDGYQYFLEEGAQGLLQYLLDTPNSDLSFYSAGKPGKIEAFLNSVHLRGKDGRTMTLKEASQGRVLDERAIGHAGTASGSTIEIKEMAKLFPSLADREMVVWLDDTATNAAGNEWKNMVLIKRLSKEELAQAAPAEKVQELNKLSRTTGLLERFLSRFYASGGTQGPRDILPGLQWNDSGGARTYRTANVKDLSLYRTGYRILRELDPSLRFVPVNDPLARCLGVEIKPR